MNRRNLVLGLALAATLIATVWAARIESQQPVAAVAAPAKPRGAARRDEDAVETLIALAPRRIEDDGSEVFRVIAPPAPVKAAAAAPAAPSAPPMPWRYVGKMEEGGRVVVLLSSPGKDIAVKQGETIDNLYRVEEIGARSIVLTFIPLKQKQTLLTGDAP